MADDKEKKSVDIKGAAKAVGREVGKRGETVMQGALFTLGMLGAIWLRDKFFGPKDEAS